MKGNVELKGIQEKEKGIKFSGVMMHGQQIPGEKAAQGFLLLLLGAIEEGRHEPAPGLVVDHVQPKLYPLLQA